MKKPIKNLVLTHLFFIITIIIVGFFPRINLSQPVFGQITSPFNPLFGQIQSILEKKYNLDSSSIKPEGEKKDGNQQLPKYVPGQLIIKTSDSLLINSVEANRLNQKYQLRGSKKFSEKNLNNRIIMDKSNLQVLEFDKEGLDMEKVAREYRELLSLDLAIPNYLLTASVIPNDPQYSSQWQHQSINSETAWDKQTGSDQTMMAIVDTGVDLDHQDLSNNLDLDLAYDLVDINVPAYLAAGFELVDSEDYSEWDTQPNDVNGHGTHVAGIAAAQGNNQIGVAGASWQAKIIPVRAGFSIMWLGQEYGLFELDDLLYALLYVEALAPDIANYSWGSETYIDLMEEFVNDIDKRETLQIAAAGNNNSVNYFYPAALDKVISVAALNSEDQKADFSNYGDWVDLAAPGVNILSTYKNSQYQTMSGTSMASPIVTGIAGLVISQHPDYSLELIKYILTKAVVPVDFELRYGRILADQAVNLTQEDFIPQPITQLMLSKENETTVHLSWPETEYAETYHIYRSTVPYFSPIPEFLLTQTDQLEYSDQNIIDNQTSYYYLVTGVNQFNQESLLSNLGIVQAYQHQVYSNQQNLHYFSLLYNYQQPGVTEASELGLDIFGVNPPSLSAVGRFNPDTDTYQTILWQDNHWVGNDWILQPGQAVYIQPVEDIDFSLVGSHNPDLELSFSPYQTQNMQYFSVPFNVSVSSAQELVEQIYPEGIPSLTVLGRFIPSLDEYQEVLWVDGQMIGQNWLLQPGQGIYLKPRLETGWIPTVTNQEPEIPVGYEPAPIENISINQQENNLYLNWEDNQANWNASFFRVYRDTVAYFQPSLENLLAETTKTEYLDQTLGIIGDPETNYFYTITVVEKWRDYELESAANVWVGEWDQPLYKDDNDYTYNFLNSVFVDTANLFADDLVDYIDKPYMAFKFYEETQSLDWRVLPNASSTAGTNFQLSLMRPIIVSLPPDSESHIFTLIGILPDQKDLFFNLAGSDDDGRGWNFISLPLNRSATKASALAQEISGAEEVGVYDAETNKILVYQVSPQGKSTVINLESSNDWFTVVEDINLSPGDYFLIRLNSLASSRWPN